MMMTIGEVARFLDEPITRVEYVLTSRKIAPAGRAGGPRGYRLYDAAGVEAIRNACKVISARVATWCPREDRQPVA